MKRMLWIGWAIVLVGAGEPAKDDEVKNELDRLQGTWTMSALEVDGKPVPEEKLKSSTLTIKGNRYIIKIGDNTHETVMKLDPGKKPKEIDMTFTEGANKDKTIKGIYDLDGDTFKMCRGLTADKDRPGDFGTWPDTGMFLVTWKRVPKE